VKGRIARPVLATEADMPPKPEVSIELNPVFLAETRSRRADLETDIRAAIPWVIARVGLASDLHELTVAFAEIEPGDCVFRAIIACELLGQASSRPDVREWLCQYLSDQDLSDGARYQLAAAYSRLGVEARRSNQTSDAIYFARRGLSVIEDLPVRAVTSNLYFNLATALESEGDFEGAVSAFDDSAEIDQMIGRHVEASESRQRIALLQRHISR
jgi:tetratricopeptide (TPR) repeat protein